MLFLHIVGRSPTTAQPDLDDQDDRNYPSGLGEAARRV
jgi:hypothetical protein